MRTQCTMWMLVLTLIACAPSRGDEPWYEDATTHHFGDRFRPAGGWHPYGGGMHWWNPNCFDWHGLPDDYCKKPLPRTCWPCAPAYHSSNPRDTGLVPK